MKIKIIEKIIFIFVTIFFITQMIFGQGTSVYPQSINYESYGGGSLFPYGLSPEQIERLERELGYDLKYDEKIRKYLLDAIRGCISESWNKVWACPYLDKYKDNINNRINHRYDVKFTPTTSFMFTEILGNYIGCGTNHLYDMLSDIGQQIHEGKTPIDVSPARYPDFVYQFAHEILHMFGLLYAQQKDECEANCLTKKCFNPEWDPRKGTYGGPNGPDLQCQNEQFDEQTKKIMGEGQCFCGVDWINKDKPAADGCEPDSPSTPGGGKEEKIPQDNGDDNYSYSNGYISSLLSLNSLLSLSGSLENVSNDFIYSYFPDILVYNKFDLDEMERLLNRSEADNFIDDFEHVDFSNNHKTLVVPSGELMGEKDSELIKQAFKRYVESGNTLLVFGQQYGEDVEKLVPVPDGESLQLYGWRQDQSCWSGSAYLSAIHPAISSWVTFWTQFGSFITDGYIESYPKNATVLLKRTKNQKPFLLYYPYGNGTVILTSMFTDWTYAHSQATGLELNIIRDLITFARNPNKPIAMYDLHKTPNPNINLNVNIKNNTEQAATKVKLIAYNPDRKKTFYQNESSISLNSLGEIEIPLSFQLPHCDNKDYGICHVDYELYDAEDKLIQPASESDGGRFALHGGIQPYTPVKGYDVWITAKTENLYYTEKAEVTLHVKNYKDQPVTLNWHYNLSHANGGSIPSLTLEAGEEKEYSLLVDIPEQYSKYLEVNLFFNLHYKLATDSYESGMQKGFFIKGVQTSSTVNIVDSGNPQIGTPINYSISARNNDGAAYGLTKIKLMVDHYISSQAVYQEIETIYESECDLSSGNPFQYSGQFISNQKYAPGEYRIRLTVTTTTGGVETRTVNFIFHKSIIALTLSKIPEADYGLIPGQSYSVNFK